MKIALGGSGDTSKWTDICMIRAPKGEKKNENFPNPGKERDIQIGEVQRVPIK